MKKSIILKLFVILVFFSCIFLLKDNVYGYQLKYRGIYSENNQDFYFISIGHALGSPPGWRQFRDVEKYVDLTSQSNYQTYKFVVQSGINTIYSSNGYRFNYLKSRNATCAEEIDKFNFSDYDQNNVGYATGKRDVSKESINRGISNYGRNVVAVYDAGRMNVRNNFFDRNIGSRNADFNLIQNATIQRSDGQYNLASKWRISAERLRGILTSNPSLYVKENESGKYFWYSNPCILHNANTYNINYNYVALDTAYDALCGFYTNGNDAAGVGYDFGSYNRNYHILTNNGIDSIINLYDNMLYIPSEMMQPQEIYIRHVECDKNGNVKSNNGNPVLLSELKNSSEIQMYNYNSSSNSWNEKLVNNMFSKVQNETGISENYQEYYDIPIDNQLKASRSLTLVNNGVTYEYKGYRASTAKTLSDAERNLKISRNTGDENFYTVEKSNDKQVTVIEFKYYKTDEETPDPQGGVKTLEYTDVNKNCQMTYTPTGEEIVPYLVTNKFKINNLTYEYEEKNNSVQYKIKKFDVNKLKSGTISDNDKVDEKYNNEYKHDVGKIFGTNDDKWSLLVGNGSATFELSDAAKGRIDQSLNKFKSDFSNKIPTKKELDSFMSSNKTTKDDFETKFLIPENRYNGIRIPKLLANYEGNQNYDVNNTSYVLVYNPIKVDSPKIESSEVVDHTEHGTGSQVIQKGADFKLKISKAADTVFNGKKSYFDYLQCYYLIFDFDIVVTDHSQYENLFNYDMSKYTRDGDTIRQGTIIQLNKDITEFKAKAGANIDETNIKQDVNRITLIGVSNNMPNDKLLKLVMSQEYTNTITGSSESRYISNTTNTQIKIDNNMEDIVKNYCDSDINYKKYEMHSDIYDENSKMYNDAYYFAKAVIETRNVGRIYDFKVTDCTDIDYKSVFRNSTSNTVNELTGVEYFSGISKFNIYSSMVNDLSDRGDSISVNGTSVKTIIPLGPYKNTNTSYVNAPKMGYRISFDLKTSGYFDYANSENSSDRKIKIKPTYYYISKDGKDYVDNITLYYKNSEGKYVTFENSNYILYFKPNDGYRFKLNSSVTNKTDVMSTQLEPLEISSKEGFYLNYKMMNSSNNYFIQSWYGEFKLPNSTIAVGGKKSNISNSLKDGYIGVKFNISCIDKKDTINYNTNNHNVKDEKTNQVKPNTSQWDYEGYLGFREPGNQAGDIPIQLEKGIWIVNDNNDSSRTSKATYNDIKGTVVLFDLDNRAANDFE